MFKFRLNTTFIGAFTLVLILIFISLVVNFYRIALEKSKESHQAAQLEMSKSAATGITHYLSHLVSDMREDVLSGHLDYSNYNHKAKVTDKAIHSRFIADEYGHIHTFSGHPLPEWIGSELMNIRKRGISPDSFNINDELCWYSGVQPYDKDKNDSPFVFLMIVPVVSGSTRTEVNVLTGYLGYVINFDWLMERFVSTLRLAENDFAWVLDGNGRLIYHPNHSEMLLRSTREQNNECLSCHTTFQVQNDMLKSNMGTGEYYIEGEPEKIMAYAPVFLNQQKWILAISTYLPPVLYDVFNNLIVIFSISGVFVVLLIAAGMSVYYINLKRIQSEEAEKHVIQVQLYQEKLDQAAKLASIGELVDSVAHEINTPTGIIATITDSMVMQDCAKLKCADDLNIIKGQVKRIKNYTKSLLSFSRRMPFQAKPNDILELIDECIFLVNPRLRAHRVDLIKELPLKCKKFVFDRARIEQIIINIINNAIDFIEDKGQIKIKLTIDYKNKRDDIKNWIVLSISDNGKGIKQEDLPSIFEPFFSTKPISKGTGLGLSISKAIIERHKGKIEVRSKLNEGTTFLIYLPFKEY